MLITKAFLNGFSFMKLFTWVGVGGLLDLTEMKLTSASLDWAWAKIGKKVVRVMDKCLEPMIAPLSYTS